VFQLHFGLQLGYVLRHVILQHIVHIVVQMQIPFGDGNADSGIGEDLGAGEHDVRVQRGIRRIMAFKDNLAVDRHQDVMHFGVRIIECIQQVQYVLRGHTVGFRRGTGHHRAFFRLTVRVVIGQRWESQGKCHCGRQKQRKQLFHYMILLCFVSFCPRSCPDHDLGVLFDDDIQRIVIPCLIYIIVSV